MTETGKRRNEGNGKKTGDEIKGKSGREKRRNEEGGGVGRKIGEKKRRGSNGFVVAINTSL